jgi:Transposase IS116/IS110/IS902 family
MIAESCRDRWERITPFLSLPPISAGRSTPPTASRTSTARSERRSRPRPLPQRTGHHQAHLPRHPASRNEMEDRLQLDQRTQRPHDPLRRPTARLNMNPVASASHTEARTPSAAARDTLPRRRRQVRPLRRDGALRARPHRPPPLPTVAPSSDETLGLRALVRTREDLVEARVALANQLRAQLDAFWPGPARIFADLDSKIALAFLARYPSPADAHGLGSKRLAGFLARHGYCGRRSVDQLLERLRGAPQRRRRRARTGRPPRRRRRTRRRAQADRRADRRADQPDRRRRPRPSRRPIFLSLVRGPKSVICAAGLLAEIGDNLARYPTAQARAADAGQAPIAIESGKRRAASFRRACDKRLRAHFGVLADSTRHWHPWARQRYQAAIGRRQTTPTPAAPSAAPGRS